MNVWIRDNYYLLMTTHTATLHLCLVILNVTRALSTRRTPKVFPRLMAWWQDKETKYFISWLYCPEILISSSHLYIYIYCQNNVWHASVYRVTVCAVSVGVWNCLNCNLVKKSALQVRGLQTIANCCKKRKATKSTTKINQHGNTDKNTKKIQ